ncbi:4-hydroxy-tetrahydrodipicolinate synthase [Schleiferia thermophila]|jgi:4-hydroxy-tetrahydrodipicolinate synthase|uniref:4-hydroxy-tetrahydrodipicolinate synthase n=1 Tax=Schleiferia thermophila TaxID=884107 RepID=A0A369AB86_9FLAO|nr:4-hydroxy-tetrahydrodipicolinate synthase [Schleiferia thermophila]KFD39925.1 dihydrodipicolinate synthase [Schleiferia thermophila str. Yellowstone]RCX05337.1 4-hydroxy-tetrahydrodipicolinate synthase [Schleiferia thermophila]GCD79156.1 4-hydroxy-tetrahydrodipicolinate synthase [Schleiferia thermophila]
MNELKGTGVALITPFDADGRIDEAAFRNLINYVINGGVEYLVVNGTTGESPTTTEEEKLRLLQIALEESNNRVPVVFGIGGNDTSKVVKQLKTFESAGVAAILSVSPYYNKPTQEGIYHHYKALSEASPLPIIVYNVPGRTSSNIAAETTLRLQSDCSNIVAVKEASGNLEQIMAIIQGRNKGFLVLSGDDNLTLPIIALGGDGVISVSGQGFPKIFSQMVRDALNGDLAQAREKHYQLFEITRLLFAEGNPGGIKALLAHLGIIREHLRMPLWPVSDATRQKIINEAQKLLE